MRHPVGLSVNGERRIFNILINNIPHTDWTGSGHWTEPLAGTIGFCCHDGKTPDAFGDPIEPADRQRFDDAMRPIVDATTRLLKALPATAARSPDATDAMTMPPGDLPSLFVADVPDGLAKLRKRLIREIGDRARILDPGAGPATLSGGRA